MMETDPENRGGEAGQALLPAHILLHGRQSRRLRELLLTRMASRIQILDYPNHLTSLSLGCPQAIPYL